MADSILNTTGYTWNGTQWVAPSAPASGNAAGAGPSNDTLIAYGKQGITWNGKNWVLANGANAGTGDHPNLSAGGAASVPAGALSIAGAANGGTPVAQGFDIFYQMLDATLRAETLRQSGIDQVVNIAQLMSQLERASPTQAADLATRLGLPGLEPNLGFANRFTNGRTTGSFGGKVGSQDVMLPFAFNGKEMTFFQNNPKTASIFTDIADRFGRPDIMKNSVSSLIPTNGSLFSL